MDREIDFVVNNRNDDKEAASDKLNFGFVLTTVNGGRVGPFKAQKIVKSHSFSKITLKVPTEQYKSVDIYWQDNVKKYGFYGSFSSDSKYDGSYWTAIYIEISSVKIGNIFYEKVSGGLANAKVASVEN